MVAGVGVPLATHLFFVVVVVVVVVVVYTPAWDSSKSWCALGYPSFLLSLSGMVAGVGVPLATHLFFVVVVVVVVVVYTPTWDK